ncbi:HD-GYP domain-containing protein [Desulfobaculum bizertense]|uniref:HDIG domain-containing protein n=1 Tax=Desulfobaculum bizertense DSM 18034 TaxID=1121442 RepID=A0A1T4VX71_9BACT|nr:HD domain-containing phosphohydrolase [Desulfobaculum bizertense]UIJ36736.1 HD domain-containing protein [Desulfobaculum bizertense]SKA69081.1 HDIG domain-containing protein [Desulfobaculum bizertense DSM 18034]
MPKTAIRPEPQNSADATFFAVSPLLISPGCMSHFSVYLRQDGEYVLYTSAEQHFTERHRRKLYDHGVTEVYIKARQSASYKRYLEDNLGTILMNENTPLRERARLFHETSIDIVREAYANRLPDNLTQKQDFTRIVDFVKKSMQFLTLENSFKAVGQLIEHDYKTYTHCMHVFLYSSAILQSYDLDEEHLIQCGLGAILHDIGKAKIPEKILNKPGPLTPAERQTINTHPLQGIALCSQVQLSQTAYNCILFHHERMDGSGYPSGLKAYAIPLESRAIAIADVYDALTSDRPYAKAMNPFQVLRFMRDKMFSELDIDMYKRFVQILSGADLI